MKLSEQLHKSKFHRTGFEPNCPQCLKDHGIGGIIKHLKACAAQNSDDNANATDDQIVAALDSEIAEMARRRDAWGCSSPAEQIAHAERID